MASSGNFATLNPLIKSSTNTFSNGNCRITSSSGGWGSPLTLAASTGKFYVEINFVVSDTNGGRIAVLPTNSAKYNDGDSSAAGSGDYAIEWKYDGDSNFITNNGSTTQSSVGGWSQGDVAAVAFDLDASPKTVQFYKNNSTIGSAENINTSAEGPFTVMIYAHNAGTWHINAGQDSTFGGNKTAGGNADGNGFGDFFYSPPSGHLALCSANLPISDDIDPAGDDGDTENPTKQFGILTYTGTGSSQSFTNLGFQPDLVWAKSRSASQSNRVADSTRGSSVMFTDTTGAEDTTAGISFDSDGFSWTNSDGSNANDNTVTYVAWCWKANGGTTTTNTDGATSNTLQANTKAGFSISQFSNSSGATTIGHGLGVAPSMYVIKIASGGGGSWGVYHKSLGATKYVRFNSNSASATASNYFNDTEPTSTVLSVGSTWTGTTIMCYAWAEIEGYSKFGKYTGNGNADGPFVYTGFRPRLIFMKNADTGGRRWTILDSERNTFNLVDSVLNWDESQAEYDSSARGVDILSNGFKIRGTDTDTNQSGNTILYGAWGDVPFKYNNTF